MIRLACLGFCLSATLINAQTLSALFDGSEGYVAISENIIAIEGEDGVVFCKITFSDDVFERYAQQANVSASDMTAICIPAEEFEN